jgi:hypothetical protein
MPESPRWLVEQGREEDAVTVLQKIRGLGEEEVRSEIQSMRSNSSIGKSLEALHSFKR